MFTQNSQNNMTGGGFCLYKLKKNKKKRHPANNIYPNSYLYYYIVPSVVLLVALC